MANNAFDLLTPAEAEEEFGKKYFYRQRIYRLGESGKIKEFSFRGQVCFLGAQILKAVLKDVELRIAARFPDLNVSTLRIFYDTARGKKIVVDGIMGGGVTTDTENETEEDLLNKIASVLEWVSSREVEPNELSEFEQPAHEEQEADDKALANVLPEEITWVRVNTGQVEDVKIKSFILVSLPSIAQFMGIRSEHLVDWLSKTTFADFVISAHPKQIHATEIPVPWKKGVVKGHTSLIPFELLPEVIVAFRQSGRTLEYPEKANLLYEIAKTTLEAVGLAISGDKDKAAQELARVGKGLGLTVADQIIGIFKQYESRDYQLQTHKEFNSKVKELGGNYAIVTGQLTFGITDKYAEQWKALGTARKLPTRIKSSSREVMRQLSPSDGVGMTFGERHYIKQPSIDEAVKTGKQGKDFYKRLKDVGLLDD